MNWPSYGLGVVTPLLAWLAIVWVIDPAWDWWREHVAQTANIADAVAMPGRVWRQEKKILVVVLWRRRAMFVRFPGWVPETWLPVTRANRRSTADKLRPIVREPAMTDATLAVTEPEDA